MTAKTKYQKARERTVLSLIEQFGEDTGRHILDSGDAYGRGFERWGRKGPAAAIAKDYLEGPSVKVDKYGWSVSTIHHLVEGLTYVPLADSWFKRWVDADDKRTGSQSPWLVSAERFAAVMLGYEPDTEWEDIGRGSWGAEEPQVVNTYNYDNPLDEVVQFVEFTAEVSRYGMVEGERYVLLSTHNGADVRGGYSRPRVYAKAVDFYVGDVSIYAQHTVEFPQDEVLEGMPEPLTFHGFDLRGGEWTNQDGDWLEKDDEPQQDEETGEFKCPLCGAVLELGLMG